MTIEGYYDSPKMLKPLHEGPLGVHIDLFAARLLRGTLPTRSMAQSLRGLRLQSPART
jgi:hypothetical protein